MSKKEDFFSTLAPKTQNSLKESLKNLELMRVKYYQEKQNILRRGWLLVLISGLLVLVDYWELYF